MVGDKCCRWYLGVEQSLKGRGKYELVVKCVVTVLTSSVKTIERERVRMRCRYKYNNEGIYGACKEGGETGDHSVSLQMPLQMVERPVLRRRERVKERDVR